MKRRLLFAIIAMAVIVMAVFSRSYYVHRAAVHQAMEKLQQIPPARAYPHAIQYHGVNEGFHSLVVASLEPVQSVAQSALAGSWVITYTGSHPPTIQAIALDGMVDGTPMTIQYQGFSPPLQPTLIGRHRYVYWETQWNNPTWPFPPSVGREEFQTSIARIRVVSGQTISIPEHP